MLIDGKKVKEARKALGKQGAVAKFAVAIDMSAPWVYALETAKSPVEVKEPLVRAMAKFLKVREVCLQSPAEAVGGNAPQDGASNSGGK